MRDPSPVRASWCRALVCVALTVLTVDVAMVRSGVTQRTHRDELFMACTGTLGSVNDLRSGMSPKSVFSAAMRSAARHADSVAKAKGGYRHKAVEISFGIEQLEAVFVETPPAAGMTGPVPNRDLAEFETLCRSI